MYCMSRLRMRKPANCPTVCHSNFSNSSEQDISQYDYSYEITLQNTVSRDAIKSVSVFVKLFLKSVKAMPSSAVRLL